MKLKLENLVNQGRKILLAGLASSMILSSACAPRQFIRNVENPSQYKGVVKVSKDGKGDFAKIQDAIDYANTKSPNITNRWMVYVYPGVYTLTSRLDTSAFVDLKGASKEAVILKFIEPGAIGLRVAGNSSASDLTVNYTYDFASGEAVQLYKTTNDDTMKLINVDIYVNGTDDHALDHSGGGILYLEKVDVKQENETGGGSIFGGSSAWARITFKDCTFKYLYTLCGAYNFTNVRVNGWWKTDTAGPGYLVKDSYINGDAPVMQIKSDFNTPTAFEFYNTKFISNDNTDESTIKIKYNQMGNPVISFHNCYINKSKKARFSIEKEDKSNPEVYIDKKTVIEGKISPEIYVNPAK